MLNDIKQYNISDRVIHYVMWNFTRILENKELIDFSENFHINSIKTLNLNDKEFVLEVNEEINKNLDEEFYFEEFCLVKYLNNGREMLNFKKNETHRFVLFLNSCDSEGEFIINAGNNSEKIKAEKGKLVVFPSKYSCFSSKSEISKNIASGYLKIKK